MKTFLKIICLLFGLPLFAQVGINTTSPDPSSVLDIQSTDKGMLIPRVSLGNVATTQIDGVHTAATGLMIYNTNASITGGSGVGFYVFNGSSWDKIITSADSIGGSDADFFEEGTSNPPDDINDNIFTQGNVAIGKTNPLYALDIVENSDDRAISAQISGNSSGVKYGSYVLNNNTGSGAHYGYYSILSGGGSGIFYGSFNSIAGSGNAARYGVYSRIQGSGNGFRYGDYKWISSSASSDNTGTYNILDGTGTGARYGTQNVLNSNSSGRIYGTFNSIIGTGSERKFGTYNFINPASGGTHFGIYSEATKTGSFAGLFNGSVAIGTSSFVAGTPDWYIMPASRGTNGQVMQTDGSGNVSWVDPSTISSTDADFFAEGTTAAPTSITDDMYTQGNVAIGKTSADHPLDILGGTGVVTTIRNEINSSGTGVRNNITIGATATDSQNNGVFNRIISNDSGFSGVSRGVFNSMVANDRAEVIGTQNSISVTGNGIVRGTSTEINGSATALEDKFGSFISIGQGTGGTHYGLYSSVLKSGSFAGYFLGNLSIGTTTSNNYILPASRGTNGQVMQTDGSGNVSWVDASSLGGGDADFFEEGTTTAPDAITDDVYTQGNVAIGKTTADYPLDILSSGSRGISVEMDGTDTSAKVGTRNSITNTGDGLHYGVLNSLSGTGSGTKRGVYNNFGADSQGSLSGIYNQMVLTSNTNATKRAVQNVISSNGNGFHFGVQNSLVSSGTGDQIGNDNSVGGIGTGNFYGVRNDISGSGTLKYGVLTTIDPTSTGTHYGTYNEVLKSGSFAGYFLGNVSIGTSTSNNYIFPASRGTNGQVMQTDGSGNVSWVDASSIASNDVDFYEVGTTAAPNAITDNIYTQGALAIGDTSNDESRLNINTISSEAYNNGLKIDMASGLSSGAVQTGITVNMSSDLSASPARASAIEVENNADSSVKAGISSTLSGTGGSSGKWNLFLSTSNEATSTGNLTGIWNTVSVGGGSATQFGVRQRITDIDGNSSGTLYGYNSDVLNAGSGPSIGFYSLMQTNNNAVAVAFDASFSGNSGTGNKYGLRATIPTTVGGTNHYGVYAEALRSGSNTFAGYFLGNVSVGTSSSDNYILPPSRGTANQIMQTDASGNVSWVDNTASSFWSRSGTTLDVANVADDISFASDQTSIIFPTTSGTPSTMIHLFDSGTGNSDRMVFSQSPTFSNWGLMYRDINDSFRFLSSGNDRVVINLASGNPLVVNGTAQATAFQSATTTYPDYVFESFFKGSSNLNPEYHFQSLDEVEKFIVKNGHLPGVTSLDEVQANDMQINLTETSVKNLEKIEELFLYAIQLKKENENLKRKQQLLENRLNKIEKLLE